MLVLRFSAAALTTLVVVFSSPVSAQDPCTPREQWIRFILADELFAGRMSIDQFVSTFQSNVSPQCGRYQIQPTPMPRPPPPIGTRPYGRTGNVCTLPDGTNFAC
jgi:hypothetical protein